MVQLLSTFGLIIKGVFKTLGFGQIAFHSLLTNLATSHPGFCAYFVEIAIFAMCIMGFLLRARKRQRMMPAPRPEVIVSPVPTPPALPDRTVPKVVLSISGVFLLLMLVLAILFMP